MTYPMGQPPQAAPRGPVADPYATADPGHTEQAQQETGQPHGEYVAPEYQPPQYLAPAGQRPEDPAAPSLNLTAEEIAEFRQLRQDNTDRRAAEQKAREEEEANRPAESHFLTLADGRSFRSAGTMTHYRGIPVVGSYPITEEETVA